MADAFVPRITSNEVEVGLSERCLTSTNDAMVAHDLAAFLRRHTSGQRLPSHVSAVDAGPYVRFLSESYALHYFARTAPLGRLSIPATQCLRLTGPHITDVCVLLLGGIPLTFSRI